MCVCVCELCVIVLLYRSSRGSFFSPFLPVKSRNLLSTFEDEQPHLLGLGGEYPLEMEDTPAVVMAAWRRSEQQNPGAEPSRGETHPPFRNKCNDTLTVKNLLLDLNRWAPGVRLSVGFSATSSDGAFPSRRSLERVSEGKVVELERTVNETSWGERWGHAPFLTWLTVQCPGANLTVPPAAEGFCRLPALRRTVIMVIILTGGTWGWGGVLVASQFEARLHWLIWHQSTFSCICCLNGPSLKHCKKERRSE